MIGEEQDRLSPPDLESDVRDAIRELVGNYFRDRGFTVSDIGLAQDLHAQSYELGIYLIKQNPYAALGDLGLPQLPPNKTVEMRRVRKAGVLRANHSGNPLDDEAAIPAGEYFPFFYEDRLSLEDDDAIPSQEQGDTAGDNLNRVVKYLHNVVKIVRFRYTLKTRGNSRAYLVCLFSGGDA